MKHQTSILSILLTISGMYAAAQQPAPVTQPAQPQAAAKPEAPSEPTYSLTDSKDWQNPAALRDKLGKRILSRLSGGDEQSVKSFLSSEYNRLLLANWLLANQELISEKQYADYRTALEKKISDRKKEIAEREKELSELGGTAVQSTEHAIMRMESELAELIAEYEQPVRLADVVKRPRGAKLIRLIANDLGWMGDILYSGECIMPGRMLNMLANMMERYPRMLPNERIPRDIATATALEFARSGWTVDAACKRAEYFVRNWRQDRLHRIFDTLPLWLRRVVCGWKGNHSSGTPESLTWALHNINLPDERYTGCCWRCGYVLHNVYGESVHGGAYYTAYEGMYTGRHHEFTQEVGGVCGGLSHFGASAACANGIPALTMGEPGHCAYLVWVNGKWTPAYSLSWDRGIHWRGWSDNHRFSSLHMLTELQSPEQKAAFRLANAYRVLGQICATRNETDKAIAHYLKAEAIQPRNYEIFREHANLLAESRAGIDRWLQLNDSLCRNMVPLYPECAAEFARNHLYAHIESGKPTADQMETALGKFWRSLRELGPEHWKVQDILDKQIALLNKVRPNSDTENKCAIYKHALDGTIGNDAYATIGLECGNTLMQKMSDSDKGRILSLMTEALNRGDGLESDTRDAVLARIILAAENNRDISAFQSVSKLVSPDKAHDNRPIGDFEAFPGKMVSEGGLLFSSSPGNRWDNPSTHANVLTKLGGKVHTNKEKAPWVAVRLPKHAEISGVVLAAHSNGANWYRLNNLQIQISETGKDDDWHNVGTPSGKCTGRILRFDLTAEHPKALYVRVIRPDANDVFHLDGFYVYGTPAA